MKETVSFIIDGKQKQSKDVFEVINPFNGEYVATVFRPSASDVEEAIQSATRAFQSTKEMPSCQRSAILKKTVELIQKNKESVARILCLETGKPIRHAKGEVGRALTTLTLASEEVHRLEGEAIPLDITQNSGNRLGIVRRFPIGPVAGISPFNFPLNLVCHKVAPALASGNSITLKPASSTPLSALRLGEILLEAGALPGSCNIIPCTAENAEKLVTDSRLKMITFTGNPKVGWAIKNKAGKKRVCLELGGNAAAVIEPDADLDYVIKRSLLGAFAYAGQICISLQRLFVHHSIFDDFTDQFVKKTKLLKLGDPLKEETDVGPMITEREAQRAEKWIKEAVKEGAKILTGGQRGRTLVQPTVLTHVSPKSKVSCQEAFAPVVVLDSYKDFKEALKRVNDSFYGLQAGVFTRDIDKAFQAFRELDVGGVMINDIPTYRVDHMPYGGVKDSGFGREGVRYAMEEMTERKIMVVNKALG